MKTNYVSGGYYADIDGNRYWVEVRIDPKELEANIVKALANKGKRRKVGPLHILKTDGELHAQKIRAVMNNLKVGQQ